MSGPKSLSPHIRRFPWKELPFNCPKGRAEQERNQRNQRPRAQREDHYDSFKEDDHRRRSPSFSQDRSLGHQRPSNQEEFYHWRLSPPCDGGGRGGGRGGGEERGEVFSNDSRMSEFRRSSTPASPLTLPRELLPPTPRHQSHRQQREAGTGWRGEEQGRDHDRFNPGPDPGPVGWSDSRRRTSPGSYREKQRGDGRHERSPPLKRPRKELEDGGHFGFRAHKDFEDHRHMQDEFKRHHNQDVWRAPPQPPLVVVEHDHGMAHGRPLSRSGPFPSGGRESEVDFCQRRHTRPSSQDRLRAPDGRHECQGGVRGNYQHNNNGKRLRANSLGPVDHRERAAHFGHGPNEPVEAYKNPARLQHLQHHRQHPPQEQQQRSSYDDPTDLWNEERRSQPWKREWPEEQQQQQQQQRQQQLQLPGPQLDPIMPRQRMQGWRREEEEEQEEQEEMTGEDMTVISKETLTIKVDMSQPVHSSSPLCYSSERQLSLDLVNVGRQRLDFLPILEHSGSYRESSATRTGTFAQEIIALVHQVREQHFSSSELTLNQRFSAPQEGATMAADEPDELTLDQRFSSTRGFSINMDSVLDDEEPLYTSDSLQPVRGPGDLRHDLERRRLERLEGVKVTICGSHVSQRPLGPISDAAFEEPDELEQMENGGFSSWPGKHSRRGYSHMGTRRAAPYRRDAPYRSANDPQRRNHRFGGRPGPMRRQNHRGNQSGPQW